MQQKILNIAHARTLDVGNLLAYIVEIYGKSIYLKPKQLVGLIADLMNEDEQVKRFYRRAIIDDHLSEKIYHNAGKNGCENACIVSLTTVFAKNNAYNDDFAKIIVQNFIKGLGCKKSKTSKVCKNVKHEFNTSNINEIVHPEYDYVRAYSEGLTLVKVNGKYGCVNNKGKEVISLKYDFVWDFSEGIALVKLNGKHGYINKRGRVITSL